MMASSSSSNAITLTENDIPGASLLGRKPEELLNSELKFWLKCRGDTGKGLKTKAELVKRIYDYIKTGKDKEIVDPDPHNIYSRRKEKQTTSTDLSENGEVSVEFPSAGWGSSLEKMSMFTRVEMNSFVMKSGKAMANKDHYTVPTGLIKARCFLDDEYLEEIECASNSKHFFFKGKFVQVQLYDFSHRTSRNVKQLLCRYYVWLCITTESTYRPHLVSQRNLMKGYHFVPDMEIFCLVYCTLNVNP